MPPPLKRPQTHQISLTSPCLYTSQPKATSLALGSCEAISCAALAFCSTRAISPGNYFPPLDYLTFDPNTKFSHQTLKTGLSNKTEHKSISFINAVKSGLNVTSGFQRLIVVGRNISGRKHALSPSQRSTSGSNAADANPNHGKIFQRLIFIPLSEQIASCPTCSW